MILKAEDLVRLKNLWEKVEPSVDEILELLKNCGHRNADGTSAISHIRGKAECQICGKAWQ